MANRPEWLDNAVFYEIYPQSFKDTDGDGIGNIKGITEKLPYIKELGCNAIWLNPCFTSPFGDAGYDVSDYYTVAPRYGTNDDLAELFEEAHKLGVHVILDLVPGHTSWEHPWFKQSMKAAKNEYTDRYIWTDSVWESPEGYGSLRGISDRNGSCLVNFFSHQPALNYGFYKPERPWQQAMDAEGPMATRKAMKDVMRFWLKLGCDGFRVDMAGSLVKNDEDAKGTIALWKDVRAFLDSEFPDAALVSEWGEPDKSLAAGFHMDFLLHFGPSHYNDLFRCENPFFEGNGDASAFVKKYTENYKKSERRGLICIPSGNHDMDRLAKHVHDDGRKLAFAFLLSMPGAPYIYYGDEIGMRYVEGLTSVEGGYERTGSRSPMQWDGSENAGFSNAYAYKLYIPIDPSPDRPTVERQINDENSLYSEVKKLIAIRQAHPALLSRGEIDFISDGDRGKPLSYTRSTEEETVLVVINPTDKHYKAGRVGGEIIYSYGTAELSDGKLLVGAKSAAFVETKAGAGLKMSAGVREKCELLVRNRNALADGFGHEDALMYVTAGMIFTGADAEVDIEKLKECRRILAKNTGSFSEYRKTVEPVLLARMVLSENPENYIENLKEVYEKVNGGKRKESSFTILASALICDRGRQNEADTIVERYNEIMKRLNREHPILTSSEDISYAMLLALSDRPVDAVTDDIAAGIEYLKKERKIGAGTNAVQGLCMLLATSYGDVKAKCDRMLGLFEAFKERKTDFGTDSEFPTLAALLDVDTEPEALADEIIAVAEYLKEKRGFGDNSMDRKKRLMFAAALVAQGHGKVTPEADGSYINGTLEYIRDRQIEQRISLTTSILSSLASFLDDSGKG